MFSLSLRVSVVLAITAELVVCPGLSAGYQQVGDQLDTAYYDRADQRQLDRDDGLPPTPQQLTNSAVVQRRYQEMLEQNQQRQAHDRKDLMYPASYQISPDGTRYVRRDLPEQLIPPGRASANGRPYRLNAIRPSSQRDSTRSSGFNFGPPIGIPANGLPPIVRPEDLHREHIQPVYLSPPQDELPPGHSPQQSHLGDTPVIRGSSPIPTKFADQQATVTRARIVVVQDGSDPQTDPDDPFADPLRSSVPQNQQDPFDDPPNLSAPKTQEPFDDQPQDLKSGQMPDDPFGERQPPIKQVDPFPNDPGNIVQPDRYQSPPTRSDDKPSLDPGTGPDETPRVRPPQQPLPPFHSPGFVPSPIRPTPPHREYPQDFAEPVYESPGQVWIDQPDLLHSDFQKSELYEGITQQPAASQYRQYSEQDLCGYSGACDPSAGDLLICDPCGSECFQPIFYFSIFGGYTQLENSELLRTSMPAGDGVLRFDDGFGVGAGLGQYQGRNLRSEFEFVFRSNDAAAYQYVVDGRELALQGAQDSFSGMLNVIWDFEPCWGYCGWRPYAGGGVGFTFVETNLSNNGVSLVATEFESNSAFAWQLMAGISRPLSAYTDIFVEYRYFSTDAIRLQLNLPSGSAVGDIHYQTDNVFFGIRMNF